MGELCCLCRVSDVAVDLVCAMCVSSGLLWSMIGERKRESESERGTDRHNKQTSAIGADRRSNVLIDEKYEEKLSQDTPCYSSCFGGY